MRKIVVIMTVCFLSATVFADGNEKLAKKADVTTGQIAAIMLTSVAEILNKQVKFNADVVCSYNKKEQMLELDILGQRGSIDGAKESTEDFIKKGLALYAKIASEEFEIEVKVTDFIINYYNEPAKKKMIQWKNGNYMIP